MKRPIIAFILFLMLFSIKNTIAQYNYVPNPSFEDYDSIPIYNGDSSFYKYNYLPKEWFNPVGCSFWSYFNSKLNYVDTTGNGISAYGVPISHCSYTYPIEGNAYGAFLPYNYTTTSYEGLRNYFEVKLKTPLVGGQKYCISFFVTLADSSYIAIDRIGVFFSVDSTIDYTWNAVNGYCRLPVNPQIESPLGQYFSMRNKWYNISSNFTATGGEQFLTIGNFRNDSNTNYLLLPDISSYEPQSFYFLDMVSVIECDSIIKPPFAGNDTTICLGDSIRLGEYGNFMGYTFEWSPGRGLSDSCIQNPLASPLQTTTYLLRQIYYSSDTIYDSVTVTIDSCNIGVNEISGKQSNINVYPNPAGKLLYFSGLPGKATAEIYDIRSKLIKSKQLNTNQIDISSLAKGLYFIKLSTKEGSVVRKFVKE